MLNKSIFKKLAMLIILSSSCGLKVNNNSKNEEIKIRNFVPINNLANEKIEMIAVSILARSHSEQKFLINHIKFNKIKRLSNNKIIIPGDGSIGKSMFVRIFSAGSVYVEVTQSGIEDQENMFEKSIWVLSHNNWQVKLLGRVPKPPEFLGQP